MFQLEVRLSAPVCLLTLLTLYALGLSSIMPPRKTLQASDSTAGRGTVTGGPSGPDSDSGWQTVPVTGNRWRCPGCAIGFSSVVSLRLNQHRGSRASHGTRCFEATDLGPVLAWRRPMSNRSQAGPAIMARSASFAPLNRSRSNSSGPRDDMRTPPSDDYGD